MPSYRGKPKRGAIETYLAIIIVLAVKGKLPKTRVMYAANLSWPHLEDVLDYLDQCGVIIVDKDLVSGRTSVSLTEKGIRCLKHIFELNHILHFIPDALEKSSMIFFGRGRPALIEKEVKVIGP